MIRNRHINRASHVRSINSGLIYEVVLLCSKKKKKEAVIFPKFWCFRSRKRGSGHAGLFIGTAKIGKVG